MFKLMFLALVLPNFAHTWRLVGDFNASTFESMPELFKMDNFDDCADTFSPIPFPKQYCIISIRLHNQDNKNLAKLVKTQNRKLNFNHEILKYGICASSCLRVHHHLKNDYAKYLTETTSLRETPRDEGKILMMNKLANVCINKELMDVYGLKAETHVDYCVQADFPYYRLDGFFVLAILVLIVLFVIGGFYEKYKNRPKFKSFLEKWKRIRRFLQSYSLRGNWNKFWDVGKNENELLTIFGGFKITLMFFFIYSQVYKQITALPFANPVYIERNIGKLFFHIFNEESLSNAFLTLSGVVTTLTLVPFIKSTQLRFYRVIFHVFNRRQDQIFPLNLFFFFLFASIFQHFSSAPFWRYSTVMEMENCKNHWQSNILMTTNYFNKGKMCMESTWILAAELHLTVIGAFILILTVRFKKFAKWILGSCLAGSVGVFGWRVFNGKLGAFALITPDFLRAFHQTDDVRFNELFYTTHMNAGNFIIGLIFGYLLIENKKFLQSFIKNWLFYYCIFLKLFVPAIFRLYHHLNTQPSHIVSALIGSFFKHHDGVLFCVIFLNLSHKLKFLSNNSTLKRLDKLFMSAFFSHLAITKLFIANTKVLLELSFVNLISYSIAIMIVSYAVAVVIHLMIEAPTVYSRDNEEVQQSEKSTESESQTKLNVIAEEVEKKDK